MKKIEELETSLEIKEGTLTKKDGYDIFVKGGEYYKHIFKSGKTVVFSFVFITKSAVFDTLAKLFQTNFKPLDIYEENIITQNGKPVILSCDKNGIISLRAKQEISENDVIRLRATWLSESE